MQQCFGQTRYNSCQIQMFCFFRVSLFCISSAALCCVFAANVEKTTDLTTVLMNIDDVSQFTWAHAVNSRKDLEYQLKQNVKFLEADVSIGVLTSEDSDWTVPIMAHPPDNSSDISLDKWLDIVIGSGQKKGIKLDFKALHAVRPSLEIITKYEPKIDFPLWLNADIVSGPIKSSTVPVESDEFLDLCHAHFPNATLSLGWTTEWHPTSAQESWHYDWQHIRNMVDAVFCKNKARDRQNLKVTFAVRAIFASRSVEQLQWLLGAVPGSTLTIWSHKYDAIDVEDLLRIRSSFQKFEVYYDIPESVDTPFRSAKVNAKEFVRPQLTFENKNWMVVTRGEGSDGPCASYTYVNNNSVVFGKSLTTAVLLKNPFPVSNAGRLQAEGYVTFFNRPFDELRTKPPQEVVLLLANVSLFSKNSSFDATNGDNEVVWSALNSSRLHVFQQNAVGPTCYMFKLDTDAEKAFQAWMLPCDVTYEGNSFEEDARVGKQVIPSRKRLVLPSGPVMFGFVSSGEDHVVVHRLKVSSETKTVVKGGASCNSISKLLFTSLCVLMIVLVFV